ncbi:MAG TPA: hypothetical protein VFD33_03535, partial [Bacillota bacterium]|nr:hypothetical protein [Bacillota bacterium]
EHMWMVDGEENLHAVFYGPSTLETKIGEADVTIKEETAYPFENKVRFLISTTSDLKTNLFFRVPRWSQDTHIQMNGKRIGGQLLETGSGRKIRIDGSFKDGDTIEIDFMASPKLIKAVDGTSAIAYGPLLYSKDIKAVGEDYYHYDLKPFADTNYIPDEDEKWDYTLLYNEERPEDYLKVKYRDLEDYEWDKAPVTIEAKMLSEWAIPMWVELVPVGCTILRRTTFTQVNDTYK